MKLSIRSTVCSFVMLLGSVAFLMAQQPQPAAQPRTAQPRVQPGQPAQPGQFSRQPGQQLQPRQQLQPGAQAQQLEPSIVTLLIIDNNKEIALGQLAEKTSQNDDVKHFAQMITKDHSDFVQKLEERAGGRGQRLGSATGGQSTTAGAQPIRSAAGAAAQALRTGAAQARDAVQAARREATGQQDRSERDQAQESRTAQDENQQRSQQRTTVAKPVIGNQPGAQLLQLHQEIADKCLDSARKDADKLSAEEFDKHFIGGQIVAHKAMLDKLQVFEQHVNQDTAQLLADAQDATKKHLDEAMKIMDNLHKQGSRETGASRPRSTQRENRE
jgi:predicted outer membrane protein